MRQAWINSFREKLGEFTGSASHYWNMRQVMVGTLQLTDEEQIKLSHLEYEIELFINPNESAHTELAGGRGGSVIWGRNPVGYKGRVFEPSTASAPLNF